MAAIAQRVAPAPAPESSDRKKPVMGVNDDQNFAPFLRHPLPDDPRCASDIVFAAVNEARREVEIPESERPYSFSPKARAVYPEMESWPSFEKTIEHFEAAGKTLAKMERDDGSKLEYADKESLYVLSKWIRNFKSLPIRQHVDSDLYLDPENAPKVCAYEPRSVNLPREWLESKEARTLGKLFNAMEEPLKLNSPHLFPDTTGKSGR